MNKKLKRDVGKVTEPQPSYFDPVYVMVTVLHPNNAHVVNEEVKEVAKGTILSVVRSVFLFLFV